MAAILKRRGAWAWVAIPSILTGVIGAIVALATYNVTLVTYLEGVNYAKVTAPKLVSAVSTIRDTLIANGYHLQYIDFSK